MASTFILISSPAGLILHTSMFAGTFANKKSLVPASGIWVQFCCRDHSSVSATLFLPALIIVKTFTALFRKRILIFKSRL